MRPAKMMFNSSHRRQQVLDKAVGVAGLSAVSLVRGKGCPTNPAECGAAKRRAHKYSSQLRFPYFYAYHVSREVVLLAQTLIHDVQGRNLRFLSTNVFTAW